VVAGFGSVGANASTEAEFGVGNERGPFMILQIGTECVSIDQTTDGVAVSVCSVGIELASGILLGNVDLGEVANARDLDVIGSLDEVNAFERSIGDGTSTAARFGAPSNLITFSVTNSANTGGCPETEVIDVVDPSRLTFRALTGGGTAVVGTGLTVFGLVRWAGSGISDVPDLMRVPRGALPNLKNVSIRGGTVGEVRAFAVVGPGETVVSGVIPLLILVLAGSVASIDLEFGAICINTVFDIKTLGAEDLNLTVLEAPLLGGSTGARLKGDGSTVGVRRCCHAFSIVKTGLDEEREELSRGLGGGEGGERDCDCSDGGCDHFNE